MGKALLFVFFMLMLSGLSTSGQPAAYVHYTIHDGLPSNKIYGMQQAPDGYIWIATDRGVSRFDGARFRNFTVSDGLASNDVFATYTDATERTWLSDFSQKLHYLQNDTLHTIYEPVPENYTKRVMPVSKTGIIYIVDISNEKTFGVFGKYYISRDTIRSNPFYDSVSKAVRGEDIVYCDLEHAVVSRRDSMWLLIDREGVWPLTITPEMIRQYYSAWIGNIPAFFHGRAFFKMGPHGFIYIDLDKRTSGSLNVSALNASRVALGKITPASLQIITDKGLIVLDTGLHITDTFAFDFLDEPNDVSTVLKDRSGNMWIGMRNHGIYLLPAFYRDIRTFRLPGMTGTVMYCNRTEKYTYFMNSEGNVFIFNGKKHLKTLYLPDKVNPGRLPEHIDLSPDIHGGLYISSIKGIFYLDPAGKLVNMARFYATVYPTWPSGIKNALYDALDDRYYFSLFNGIFSFSHPYGIDSAMLPGRYNHIAMPDPNTIWLGNDRGISQWSKTVVGGKVSLREKNRINGLQVSDMVSDQAGNIIVQINGRGIQVFGKQQATYFIPEKTVQRIRLSGGGLWMASGKGIKFLTLENGRYGARRYYPNIRGLLYEEVYDLFSDSTHLTLMTGKGMLEIPLGAINSNDSSFTRKPAVTIGFAGGLFRPQGDRFETSWQKTDVSFNISTYSASYLGDISYKYYMEGLDHSLHTTSQPVISYPVLPPGRYLFHVWAKVNDLDVTSGEMVIAILVKPRWWQSLWFKGAAVLLVSVAICFLFLWRMKRARLKLRYQSSLENRAAQMELMALQSQMNPHFIFNALGAVKSYFRLNRAAEAEQMLEDFAQLIRMYLEFSRHQLIPLQQDILALKIYTAIEQQRFEYRFSVVFLSRISQEQESLWQIPPMILQPFVENAINHGLFRKQGPGGRLRLFFLYSGDTLIVVIDDNGVGRKRAAALNSRMEKLFPSRGSGLVADRIQVLNETGIASVSYEIKDKHGPDNEAAGTRVIIRFFKKKT